jgi:hypothetical protein
MMLADDAGDSTPMADPASHQTAAHPLAFQKKMHLSKNDEFCGV